ncbi:MAG: bifunctional hydroxymethylpyrimidine kinase/phosphomethylpyrimidine kinase [Coriobacteriia bacterium]|nr:bifunctional hydroxymethylpyrimidine kinase/phosphomethylpyrimidine kinase [Coriobacteriia bacterium]
MKAHDEVSPYVNVKSVVSIAGSDSSGGAGIQADLKTFMAHAVFGQSVITSVTAQNTLGVQGVADVPPHFIATQIDSVFQDIHPDAVKIGMLSNPEIIKVVAQKLLEHKAKHIVLDPVLVATSGSALIQKEAIELLISELLPLAEVITPNIYEAEILSGFVIKSKDDMLKAAKQIRRTTDAVIMIKGGHLEGRADDLVLDGERIYWLEAPRVDNENTHGTGCSLSSAIASNLARGDEVLEAIKGAKNYVYGAIEAGLDIGTKRGPLDHLYQYR